MFDREIRGQLAMLMGGRAAEQLTCAAVSTGAVDDIRRATDLALRSVSEFGLSAAVGPLNVGVLAAGSDDGAWLMRDNGKMATLVEAEVSCTLSSFKLTVVGAVGHALVWPTASRRAAGQLSASRDTLLVKCFRSRHVVVCAAL